MKKIFYTTVTVAFSLLLLTGCNSAAQKNESAAKEEIAATPPAAVTNPNLTLALAEYSELSEKSLVLLSKFEFDAWGEMLAENVEYAFPDGDEKTRTKLEGKAAVLDWWKNWKDKSGIQSMTMSEFNHIPINVTGQIKGGAPTGIYDIAYFSNEMVINGKTIDLRMNFSVHFNADKKIDRYTAYYDRSVIIKATGKNILEEIKTKK